MIIDHATIYPVSEDEEFFETLKSYEQDWFIGTEADPDYSTHILNNKQFLFSLYMDSTTVGLFIINFKKILIYFFIFWIYLKKRSLGSRTLSLQKIKSPLASLNSEIVKSIWSSTNLELLFMTNDDEERSSIQAQQHMLRNLTIQSSDAPLGYSIYNSENIYLSVANPFI